MCMSFHFSCFVMFPFFAPKIKNGVLPKDRNPITEINKGTHTVLTPLFYFYFTHNPKTLHGHPEPAVSTPSDGFTPEMTRAYLLSGHSSLKGHGGKDLIGRSGRQIAEKYLWEIKGMHPDIIHETHSGHMWLCAYSCALLMQSLLSLILPEPLNITPPQDWMTFGWLIAELVTI